MVGPVLRARAKGGDAEHEHMTRSAEKGAWRLLEVPSRRIGAVFPAIYRGLAREEPTTWKCWLCRASQAWREISSCSKLAGTFQARRMNGPLPAPRTGKDRVLRPKTLQRLPAFAVGRALIAVMENHQQADGSILVPGSAVALHGRPWNGSPRQ